MAIFVLAYKEMVTGMKKVLIWMVPLHFEFHWLLSPMVLFQQEFLMASNSILTFCRIIRFIEVCVSKLL